MNGQPMANRSPSILGRLLDKFERCLTYADKDTPSGVNYSEFRYEVAKAIASGQIETPEKVKLQKGQRRIKCAHCKRSFPGKFAVYCSNSCAHRGRYKSKVKESMAKCEQCGKDYVKRFLNKTCSPECNKKRLSAKRLKCLRAAKARKRDSASPK